MELKVEGLGKDFGPKRVLDEFEISLSSGDLYGLFGPNGSGKTTLLLLISSIMKPNRGKILIDGHEIRKDTDFFRRKVGLLSHQTFLYTHLTARENLLFYGNLYSSENIQSRIDNLLERVKLKQVSDDLVLTYSQGMRQRLAIARAILPDPPILLLDEPFSNLDSRGCEVLEEILLERLKESILLVATHNLSEGLRIMNRAGILNHGKIQYEKNGSMDGFRETYLSRVASH
jgi:ABC-type multidrug transport system ATPase subunit